MLEMKWIFFLLLGCSLAEITSGWTYHYSNTAMTWTKARQWCKNSYTDMVVIQSQEENDYLIKWLPVRKSSPYFWIGITKKHPNEPWTWIGNNSTWIGENSWAENEPNNNHSTEFCVEIYTNNGPHRGKWNDEKCTNKKFPLCYTAQCNATTCDRGRCQETINHTTCLCEPGFMGDRCQTAVECPPLSQHDNGYVSCRGGNLTFNTTCHFKCYPGFLMKGSPHITCGVTGIWSGPRPYCESYKRSLMIVAGFAASFAFFWICFCWMKRRKRKKLAQLRQPEDATSPSAEAQG